MKKFIIVEYLIKEILKNFINTILNYADEFDPQVNKR